MSVELTIDSWQLVDFTDGDSRKLFNFAVAIQLYIKETVL